MTLELTFQKLCTSAAVSKYRAWAWHGCDDCTLRYTATHCNILLTFGSVDVFATQCNTLCNTLQHTATHCNILQYIATHCNTQQHTATHCNTMQRTSDFWEPLPVRRLAYLEVERGTCSTTALKHKAGVKLVHLSQILFLSQQLLKNSSLVEVRLYIYIYMYIHICTYVYIYMYTYIYICIYMYIYIIDIYVYIYIYVQICLCVYAYRYICVYIYICTNILMCICI